MKTAKYYNKFFFILFFFPTLLFAQNAIVGTGFSSGWDNGSCNDNSNFKYLGSSGFGGTYILTTAASGTGNRYFRLGVDWSSSKYSVSAAGSAGQNNSVVPNTAYTVNASCDNTGSMFYNVASTSYNYVFKTSAAGTTVGGNKFVFFEIQGAVRIINAVNRDITSVSSSQSPIITANLDGSLSTGQSVYLRYSTDNFATSSIQQMTGSGITYTATIPTVAPGLTVKYYVFTSGNNLTISHADADLFTINGNTNGGANYTYTVSAAYQSKQSGLWNDFNTWQRHNGTIWVNATSGQVPSSADGVVMIQNGHIVTIGNSVTIDQVVVSSGGTLDLNGAVTLTINDGVGTDLDVFGTLIQTTSTLTNNGQIVVENGGLLRQAKIGTAIPTSTWISGSTCEVTGWESTMGGGIDQAFSNFTYNCTGQTVSFLALEPASMSVSGLFKVLSTGTGALSLGNDSIARSLTVGSFDISGTSKFYVAGALSTANMSLTITNSFNQSGGFFEINRTNTNTGTCSVGTTFTLSGGTTRVMNNSGTGAVLGTLTISGNTIISGGTLDLSAAGNTNGGRLFLRGDLTVSSGTLLYTQALTGSSASSGIYFDGSGNQTFTHSGGTISTATGGVGRRFFYKISSGPTALNEIYNGVTAQNTIYGSEGTPASGYAYWPSSGTLLKTITINNPAGVTLQSTKSVGTTLFLKNGLFNLNSQSFTMTNGSTIDRTGGTISATPTGTSYNVLYSPHTSGLTTDLELPITTTVLNDLTINNGNTITLQSNKTVNGNLAITTGVFDIVDKTINRGSVGGTLAIADSAKLKIGGTNSFPTNFTTHNIDNNSIVEYAGLSQVIATTNKTDDYDYGFLELSGSGSKTLGGVVDVYNDLTINGGNLLVNNSEILRVRDEFKNISGTATFENNASLIQVNNVQNIGNITYKRIAQQRRLDYVYWSSPVNDFNLSSHTSNGLKYLWNTTVNNANGTQGNWQPASGIMNAAQGYIINGPTTFDNTSNQNLEVPFFGTPRNGDYTIAINRGNYIDNPYFLPNLVEVTNLDDNWNLIGNPYPSSISSRDFLTNNSSVLTGALYIWKHISLPSPSISPPFYQNFTYNYDPTEYIPYNLTGNLVSTNPDYFIGAGQGFFVTMIDGTPNSSSVTFTNNLRNKNYTNSTGTNFFRLANPSISSNYSDLNRIWLDILKQEQPGGRTMFGYVSGATMQRDNLYDATTKSDNTFKIYTLEGEDKYVIQGRAMPFDDNDVVPLGVDVIENGIYTIALAMTDGLFNNNTQDIFLEDKYTNTIHNLRQNPYFFSSEAGSYTDRFLIRYHDVSNLNSVGNIDNNSITIWTNNNINIKSDLQRLSQVTVYDILGRKINSTDNIDSNSIEIPNLKRKSTYILKIILNNGKIVYRKIIF